MPTPFNHRQESRVEFLGEQDGPPERLLKADLATTLGRYRAIRRAYLARVGFQPEAMVSVALCVAPATAEDTSVVRSVGEIFSRHAGPAAHLDVVFVTDEQEVDLRRVCRPFFERK